MVKIGVVLIALASAVGCSTVTASLMQRGGKPKPATVEGYVCRGDAMGLESYLGEFRIERSAKLEATQAAISEVETKRAAECPARLK